MKDDWRQKTEIEAIELDYKQQDRTAKPKVNGVGSKWYESSPDVLKRRQIVLRNPQLPAKTFCKLFDSARIGLPAEWESQFKITTWVEAYEHKKARALVQKMISTDKKKK